MTIKLWRLRGLCSQRPRQMWQHLHIQTGIWIHVWKQPRVHNHCIFCLFNNKNEGFCIMEVWVPHTTCCQWQTLEQWSDDYFITWCCLYLNEIIYNWRLIFISTAPPPEQPLPSHSFTNSLKLFCNCVYLISYFKSYLTLDISTKDGIDDVLWIHSIMFDKLKWNLIITKSDMTFKNPMF